MARAQQPPTFQNPQIGLPADAAARWNGSSGGGGMDFSQNGGGQLGNAWMDQYNPSGGSWGRQSGPGVEHDQMVEQARGGGLLANQSNIRSTALNQALSPSRPTNTGSAFSSEIPNQTPSLALMDGRMKYADPNITQRDRLGRAAKGALHGYDTGNKYGNVALNVGAGMAGAGTANRVAGAVQGYASDEPVTRNWKGPGSTTQPGTKTPSSASRDALASAMTDPSGVHRPMGGGGGMGFYGGAGDDYEMVGNPGMPSYRQGGVAPNTPGTPPPMDPNRTWVNANGTRDPYIFEREQASGEDLTGDGFVGDPNRVTYPEDPNRAWQVGSPPESQGSQRPTPPGGFDPGTGEPVPGGAEQDALSSVLQGGQEYQTDGSNGRIGRAGSGGGGYDFGGFDFGQDPANRDIGKSAKYAFSHLAGLAGGQGVPQPRTKQEAENWFVQHIQPGMEALGYKVSKVVGDKAFISTRENPGGEWIDFVGNAGGEGRIPLTWQSEGPSSLEADPESIFAVDDFGGGSPSGMERGAGTYTSDGSTPTPNVGGVLDSGNTALNQLGSTLVQRLLEGAALDDTLGRDESRKRVGITPESLKAVGF